MPRSFRLLASLAAALCVLVAGCAGDAGESAPEQAEAPQATDVLAFVDIDTDITVYFIQGSKDNEQLHALHVGSGVHEQLTNLQEESWRSSRTHVALSPDAGKVAHGIQVTNDLYRVAIGESVGSVDFVVDGVSGAFAQNLYWNPDGSALTYIDEANARTSIYRIDVESQKRALVDDFSHGYFMGTSGEFGVIQEKLDDQILLIDLRTGRQTDAMSTERLAQYEVSSDGRKLFVHHADLAFQQIELVNGRFGEGSETELSILGIGVASPNGEWLAYLDDPPFAERPSFKLGRLDDLTSTYVLYEGWELMGVAIWTPDSAAVVKGFSQTRTDMPGLVMLGRDGSIHDLEIAGTAVAVVPGDPEGLASN